MALHRFFASCPGTAGCAVEAGQLAEGEWTHLTGPDARYMLKMALLEPDPVIVFEHALLYPMEGDLDEREPADLFHAAVRRTGSDLTLVTYGGSLWKSLQAAEQLAEQGIDVEVIDLRSLRPLDISMVLASLSRTHRVMIVDEGWRTCSLAAEISAQVMEQGFYDLDAPVARVCSAEVPIPYAKHLEDAALPSVESIIFAAKELYSHE